MPAQASVSGLCPHCHARIEPVLIVGAQPGRCVACGGQFLAVLPEASGVADGAKSEESELVQLLPLRKVLPSPQGRSLAERTPVVLRVSAVAFVALLVLGALALLFPEGRGHYARIASALLFLLVLPLTALLARVVVRFVIPRDESGASDAWRSSLVVAYGVTALAVGPFLWPYALWFLGSGRIALALAMLCVGVPPGILVSRLARARPYRHALAVLVTFAIGFACVMAPLGGDALSGVLHFVSIHTPLLLAGAFVGVQLGRAPAPPAAA